MLRITEQNLCGRTEFQPLIGEYSSVESILSSLRALGYRNAYLTNDRQTILVPYNRPTGGSSCFGLSPTQLTEAS